MVAYARRRKSHKRLWGVGILVLVGVVVALIIVQPWREKSVDEGEGFSASTVVKPAELVEPESTEPATETEVVEKEEVKQYEGSDPNEVAGVTGVVTYAGASGNYLMVRVNIDQYLSGGACRLDLLRGGEVQYTDTAPVVDAVATSTCEGFNVSLSDLVGGSYGIVVSVTADDGRSGEIRGEVSL